MNFKDKVKSALDSAKIVAKNAMDGKDLTVSDDIFNKRMSVCQGCEHHIKATNQCGDCGCFLSVKAKLAGMQCPKGKW